MRDGIAILRLHGTGSSGTFEWTDRRDGATRRPCIPTPRGIDVMDGALSFVSKNGSDALRAGTWTRRPLPAPRPCRGRSNLQPDRLTAIVWAIPISWCTFAKDRRRCGLRCTRARQSGSVTFTIVEGTDYSTETNGLGLLTRCQVHVRVLSGAGSDLAISAHGRSAVYRKHRGHQVPLCGTSSSSAGWQVLDHTLCA